MLLLVNLTTIGYLFGEKNAPNFLLPLIVRVISVQFVTFLTFSVTKAKGLFLPSGFMSYLLSLIYVADFLLQKSESRIPYGSWEVLIHHNQNPWQTDPGKRCTQRQVGRKIVHLIPWPINSLKPHEMASE